MSDGIFRVSADYFSTVFQYFYDFKNKNLKNIGINKFLPQRKLHEVSKI